MRIDGHGSRGWGGSNGMRDDDDAFVRFFEEEVAPTLRALRPPFPFERIHPRLRDFLLDKGWMVAVALLAILLAVTAVEMFTNLDLGLVPNGPQ